MNKTTHTPGPWVARQYPTGRHAAMGWWVLDSTPDVDGKVVANAICSVAATNDDTPANALVIAAAPDLKAACETLLACNRATDSDTGLSLLYQAVEQARAALKLCEVQQ